MKWIGKFKVKLIFFLSAVWTECYPVVVVAEEKRRGKYVKGIWEGRSSEN